MKLTTELPVAHLFFKHWHTDDTEVGIVVVKAQFVLHADGALYTAPEAPQIVMADQFNGDPATTSLISEQDIAPFKPATDLVVRGVAKSPDGQMLADWPVAVTVQDGSGADRAHWGFQVRGPTVWRKEGRNWRIARTDAVSEVELNYGLAYGGTLLNEDGAPGKFCGENPIGIGFATPGALKDVEEWPAPQIGELGEFMEAAGPTQQMSVRGFGPIAKTWLPRRASAGTFDETWERTRQPRMPSDYDLTFWNAAPNALQLTPHLHGDETILLSGMRPDPDPITLNLPGLGMALHLQGQAAETLKMTLDTVSIDTTQTPKVDMVWRALIRAPQSYRLAQIDAYGIRPTTTGT